MTSELGVRWEELHIADRASRWWPCEAAVRFLAKHRDPDRPMRVLEVGCGVGGNLQAALRMGYFVDGVDIAPAAINKALDWLAGVPGIEPPHLHVASAAALPFEDRSFDLVLDVQTIQHQPGELTASLREAARVLKLHGRFFTYWIAKGTDYRELFGDCGPVAMFTDIQLAAVLGGFDLAVDSLEAYTRVYGSGHAAHWWAIDAEKIR